MKQLFGKVWEWAKTLGCRRTVLICLLLVLFAVCVFYIFRIKQFADQTLAIELARQKPSDSILFDKIILTPYSSNKIKVWQSTDMARSITKFQDSYFLATDGGLLQLKSDGQIMRHFTVLDGLPESDLITLETYQNKLFIGTKTKGLVTFDGKNFEQFRFPKNDLKTINCFLIDSGRLLIGTFSGGLLEFDGTEFREIKTNDSKQRFGSVTFLKKIDAMLVVGTFDKGIWLFANAVWRNFSVNNGLLSNRVIGLEKSGERLLVATDFGVSTADLPLKTNENAAIFHKVAVLPTLSGFVSHQNRLFVTQDNGDIFLISDNLTLKPVRQFEDENFSNSHLISLDDKLWLLTDKSVWQSENSLNFKRFVDENNAQSSNFISALAIDDRTRIWLGTFRHGIDVVNSKGQKITRINDVNIREINSLHWNKKQQIMTAATSNGAFSFDNSFNYKNLVKPEDLLSNSVLQTAESTDNITAFATSRGLSINQNGRTRSLTSVNGLPSNSLYSAVFHKNSLYVGTLSGLAEIKNGQVVHTYQTSNSKLRQNWISVLCSNSSRLFIGTYSGGVFELLPSGEIHPLSDKTENFTVNPNAIFCNEKQLLIGTLTGLKTLDLQTNQWSTVTAYLPSENVMSLTADAQNIYAGTTNGLAIIEKNGETK